MIFRSHHIFIWFAALFCVALVFWLWLAVLHWRKRIKHYYLCDGLRWYLGSETLDGPYCDACNTAMRAMGQNGDAQVCPRCDYRVPGYAHHLAAKAIRHMERDRTQDNRTNFRVVGQRRHRTRRLI